MGAGRTDIFKRVITRVTNMRGLYLVQWWLKEKPYVVQVYVDGQYYDMSIHEGDGEMWVFVDHARDVQFHLVGVEAHDRYRDCAEDIEGFRTWAKVGVIRDESLPVASEIQVRLNGETDAGHRLWRGVDGRAGFGGWFGESDFGIDGGSQPGWGRGDQGLGGFGMDGKAWEWRRDDLEAGEHELGLNVNVQGVQVGTLESDLMVNIDSIPKGVQSIEFSGDVLSWIVNV